MNKLRTLVLLAFTYVLAAALPAFALDIPQGRVILTVTGNISQQNASGAAQFDLAMLEALEGREAAMETPWTEGKRSFSGPLLRSLLQAVGANGKTLVVRALNDYAAEVPSDDAALDVILAVRMDGEEMPVREKGPVFLVYPFDLDPGLKNEMIFSRSVWQIKEIEVRD